MRCVRTPLLALLCASAATLAACDGENLFPTEPGTGIETPPGGTPPGGTAGRDTLAPTVAFLAPQASGITLAGDSVLTRIRITDERALGSLEIAAYGMRGDAQLGTLEAIERYASWKVELGSPTRAVTDTTVTRVLRANDVIGPDPVAFLIATARDTAGNVRADTVRFAIAAPRVEIASPATGVQVPAGAGLRVRVVAEDRVDRIRSVRLISLGAVSRDTVVSFASSPLSLDTVIVLDVPVSTQGQVQLGVEIATVSGFRKEAVPVAVSLGDATAPSVRLDVPAYGFRAAVGDSVQVQVRSADNHGLQSLEISGFAVRGSVALGTAQTVARFAPRTVVLTGTTPVRDTVLTRFLLPTEDTLPESAVYIVATARDLAGNVRADTSVIMLARPRIAVTRPAVGNRLPAGTPMWIRVQAVDAVDRIDSVYVRVSGVVSQQFAIDLNAPAQYTDSLALQVPADREGDVRIEAEVRSVSGFRRSAEPVTVSVGDVSRPTAIFRRPVQGAIVAVGDSVFVEVEVGDNRALASLELSGYALRGNRDLGSQQRVPRFAPKTVTWDAAAAPVTQATVTRYLLATVDSMAEDPVFLRALVRDRAGNVDSATVRVVVGGPRAQLLAPAGGQEFRAGTQLQVRGMGMDRTSQIRSLVLRLSGAVDDSIVYSLGSAADSVEHVFTYPIPSNREGSLTLAVIAENRLGIRSISREIDVRIAPPVGDNTPPVVRFTTAIPRRLERTDDIQITVSATDDTRVDSLGAVVRSYRINGGTRTLMQDLVFKVAGNTTTFRIPAGDLMSGPDALPLSVAVEITGFAVDSAGNCSYATVPARDSNFRCRTDQSGQRVFTDAGASEEMLIIRGRTVALENSSDRIADLVAARGHVFVSNLSRNRLEYFAVGASSFNPSGISVGSQPWGLAVGTGSDSLNLFVANSGGTNISVVSLAPSVPRETHRIRTSDVRLYDVTYDIETNEVGSVVMLDYSDRPQFVAQTSRGQLVYSTRPTPAASDGTVRIVDPRRDTTYAFNRGSEIFVRYADEQIGKAIVVNALDARLVTGSKRLYVCPRKLTRNQAEDPPCYINTPDSVWIYLDGLQRRQETDTRIDLGFNARTVGLTDTTYVAVSGDHSTVAFGEGVARFGRVMLFGVRADSLVGTSRHTEDLIGNAADRVIGLGLNHDGSLGAARGNQVYFFSNDVRDPGTVDPSLRLEGSVTSGAAVGGVALHPANRGYPLDGTMRFAFASGLDESGASYIDVVDTYSFRSRVRIPLRDPVIGRVVAVPVPPGQGVVLRLFAVTGRGVVQIDLGTSDLPN